MVAQGRVVVLLLMSAVLFVGVNSSDFDDDDVAIAPKGDMQTSVTVEVSA